MAEARSATAQARFTALLVTGLPLAGLALGELAQPGFVAALVAEPLTAVMIAVALVLQAVAFACVRRIARVGEAAMTRGRALAAGAGAARRVAGRVRGERAMTLAVVLAALAGVLRRGRGRRALGAGRRGRRAGRDRRARSRAGGGHLGAMTVLLARIARRGRRRCARRRPTCRRASPPPARRWASAPPTSWRSRPPAR